MNIISTVHTPTSLTSTCSSPGPDSGHGICLELAWGRCSRDWPCHQRLPLHCCLVIQVFSLPTTSSAVIAKLSLSVDRAVLRKAMLWKAPDREKLRVCLWDAAGVIMEINDLYIVSQPLFAKTSLQGIWSKIYFSTVKKKSKRLHQQIIIHLTSTTLQESQK